LSPLEFLDRVASLVTPPRLHKHRYCGVLAPNARLRRAVVATAGPTGATVQLLEEACARMGLSQVGEPTSPEVAATGADRDSNSGAEPTPAFRRGLSRSWAVLLARIYEYLPLLCPHCHSPMRIVAFVQEPHSIERILRHLGEPVQAPELLPARAPPQRELEFDQTVGVPEWPDEDQTAGRPDDEWE
jgi:hypothetical protein